MPVIKLCRAYITLNFLERPEKIFESDYKTLFVSITKLFGYWSIDEIKELRDSICAVLFILCFEEK